MSFANDVRRLCQLVLDGKGVQEIPLFGKSANAIKSARVYVSGFNLLKGCEIKTRFCAENNTLKIGFGSHFKQVQKNKFETVDIPIGFYRFMNGHKVDADQLVKLRVLYYEFGRRLDAENVVDGSVDEMDIDDLIKINEGELI